MLKVYDFQCNNCQTVFEDFVDSATLANDPCPKCGHAEATRLMSAPAVLTAIVPSYPGSKRVKAGYQHTHNRPAEKAGSQVSMYKPKS